MPKSAASKLESDSTFDGIKTSVAVPGRMLDRVALDVSITNNSGSSWKTVTKGKRSKKPMAKSVNGITKPGNRSPKRFDGSITGKLISKEAEHIPPKKRHALQFPSEPQFSARDESLLPQPLTPSPHGDSKLQSKGFCGSPALNSRDCVAGVNNADFSKVVDQKLYNAHDFSGIALLAAAACIDVIDDDDDVHFKDIEEPSSEPINCFVSMERQSSLPGDTLKENTEKCSSLDNHVALPQSLQENEDVSMELEASKVDRRHWDLNVMMDAWQEPMDYSGEGAPSVDVSGHNMEVEKLEEEGCKIAMKSRTENSTENLRPVNQTDQIKSELASNSSTVQPNSNDFAASSSSSHSVTCTLKGQLDNTSVPGIIVSESVAHFTLKEPKSFADEHCISKAGQEVRATLPVSSPEDVGSLSDIPVSGSAKIRSSLDDCRNSDVSQDDHCYTVGSKDMTGFQDGNDSPYEDGELRMLMPYPWEENEMDDGDNECVDYESDGRGVDSDGADCPGSEVVEACPPEVSLSVEKRSALVREVPFSDVNLSGTLKSTEIRYMKEETEKTEIGGIKSTTRFTKTGQFMRNDKLRRRLSSGHLDGMETTGSYFEDMNHRNKGKLQSYGEGSESIHAMERTNTGYLMQSNRPHTYSRPIRDFSPDKFMGRQRSTYHVRERNGENDQWGEYWGSRNRLATGRQGPDGHSYNRPRNMTTDISGKLSGLNSQDHTQSVYYSSKAPQRVQSSRSTYERDDYYNVNRKESASTNRSRGSSGNYPQGGRVFRDECYNPSHENHALNSSRRPRYLNGHEPSFSPSCGRFTQNSIPRRRSHSRSRSRSPHPWHQQRERNQGGGRKYARSSDFKPGARERVPFDKPSFHADHSRSYASPPRARFPPQHNRRWDNDYNHVENQRNRRSPGRMPERASRFDSMGSAGQFKENDYQGPRVRPGRFPPAAGTRTGCKFDNYDDMSRDDRADPTCRSRHSDANVTASRFRHDPEGSYCQDDEDARINTKGRDAPRSSREDRISCKV